MSTVKIQIELEVFRAFERVEQITGCLEETPEEAELIALVNALEEWLRHNPVD